MASPFALHTVFVKEEREDTQPEIKKEEVDLGEDVVEVSDEDDDSFLCSECAFTTHSADVFARHDAHHKDSDKKLLICAECAFATSYRGDFNIHMMTKHPPDEKPVIYKPKPPPDAAAPPKPEALHAVNLSCGRCSFTAGSNQGLLRHLVQHPDHTLNDVFICGGKCPFKSRYQRDLLRHVQADHSDLYSKLLSVKPRAAGPKQKIYKCSRCSFRAEERFIAAHMAKAHTFTYTRKEPIKWYQCGECGIKLGSEDAIARHLQKCLPLERRPPYLCGHN